jgi:hypothetical protein
MTFPVALRDLMLAARLVALAEVPAAVFLCCIAASVFHVCDFFRRSRMADAARALGGGAA